MDHLRGLFKKQGESILMAVSPDDLYATRPAHNMEWVGRRSRSCYLTRYELSVLFAIALLMLFIIIRRHICFYLFP